jgi:uncharacterized protein YraI
MFAMRASVVGDRVVPRTRWMLGAVLVALFLAPAGSAAQTCTDCAVAATPLNLRQEPGVDAAILRVVPAGSTMQQTSGEETNGYIPVTYDRVPGWVVASGLEGASTNSGSSGTDTGTAVGGTGATADDQRVTLAPLVLRDGPSIDDGVILAMPEGSAVTLTGAGDENGYVTVDYNGTTGWAYADLLGSE